MRALAVFVLAPAFALGAVAGAVGIVGKPLEQTQKPDSLVWAGRVFATQHSFDKWLHARGGSYAAWAGRHPSSATVFGRPDERRLAATSPDGSTQRTKNHWLLAGVVAAAALVFLLAVSAGASRLPARGLGSRLRSKDKGAVPAHPPGRLHVLMKSAAGWRPVFAAPATAVRHPPSLAATVHDLRVSPRVRRLLPTVAFYAASFVLAIVIGAAVAIYIR